MYLKAPSHRAKALARARIQELEAKLAELQAMKSTLEHLVHCCHGDERPDCPIIDTLASGEPVLGERHPVHARAGLKPGKH